MDLPTFNNPMFTNEFDRPFSVDFAPHGSRCEWCGALAESQITAIGGAMHNQGGCFCRSCGERFCALVANALHTAAGSDFLHVYQNSSRRIVLIIQDQVFGGENT
jgi:hypothetical protein